MIRKSEMQTMKSLRAAAAAIVFGVASPALAWETSVKDLGFKEQAAYAIAGGRSGVILAGCERNTDVAFVRLPLEEKVPIGFKHVSFVLEVSIDDGEIWSRPGHSGQSATGHFLLTSEMLPDVAGELYGMIARAKKSVAIRARRGTDVLASVQVSAAGSRAAMQRIASICDVDKAAMAAAAGEKTTGPVANKLTSGK